MSLTERAGLFPLLLLTGCAPQVAVTGPPSGSVVDSMLSRSAADISAMQYRLHQSGPSAQRPVSPSAVRTPTPLLRPTAPVVNTSVRKPSPFAPALSPVAATGSGPASGFVKVGGAAPTLREGMRKIVPAGQTVTFDKGASPDVPQLWRWTGNDRWPFVVDKMLTPHGLKATVDPKTSVVNVGLLKDAKATPVSTSATSTPLPPNRPGKAAPVVTQKPPSPAVGRNPFRGDSAPKTPSPTTPVAKPPALPVKRPVVVQLRHWRIEPGSTVKDWLYSQAAAEPCTVSGIKNWTVAWMTPVNYRVDAPLIFDGNFRDMLNRLFTLYGTAKVPLYAGVRPAQCVISVDDKEVQ